MATASTIVEFTTKLKRLKLQKIIVLRNGMRIAFVVGIDGLIGSVIKLMSQSTKLIVLTNQ